MVEVRVLRDRDGKIFKFEIEGHAEYGEYGSDLVCSAVSAIAQTTILGFTDLLNLDIDYEMTPGLIDLELPDNIGDRQLKDSQILLETMLLGFRSVEMGYEEYISIQERTVE